MANLTLEDIANISFPRANFGGYRAEDVYMTSGASSALAMLAYALLSPGDEVLTLSP